MEALLLAGGFGTRLRPLTYTRPKPLLPVAGRPMIEWVMDRLPPEVDKVVVAVNWQGERLEAHFEASERDLDFAVVREDEPLGTGGAVKNCEAELGDRFFVLNADIVSDMDLAAMLTSHAASGAEATISLKQVPEAEVVNYGVVRFADGVRIAEFVEKPETPELAPTRFINAGAYLMERSILRHIEPGRLVSMEKQVFPKIIDDRGLYGQAFDGYWMDVGDGDRLRAASRQLDPATWHGPDSLIEGEAEDTLAGDRLRLRKGARLTRCVLGDDVTVEPGVELVDCIVGDGQEITKSAIKQRIWHDEMPAGYPDRQIGNAL